jgi:hypothetical protein
MRPTRGDLQEQVIFRIHSYSRNRTTQDKSNGTVTKQGYQRLTVLVAITKSCMLLLMTHDQLTLNDNSIYFFVTAPYKTFQFATVVCNTLCFITRISSLSIVDESNWLVPWLLSMQLGSSQA